MKAKIEYPKTWDDALKLEKRLKVEVEADYGVNNVVLHNMYGEYYSVCFVVCRYTQRHKFVEYIKEKYGLEFVRREYCHYTMTDSYDFILRKT